MALLLKDLEELKRVGDIYEFDASKRYLLVIEDPLPASQLGALHEVLQGIGLTFAVLAGTGGKWHVFEMEHEVELSDDNGLSN